VLKYVLTANAPETKDNDFTWKDFQAHNNNELVAILGNFVNRALVLTQKYYDGIVPAAGNLLDVDKETLSQLSALKADVEKNLDHFRFREALKIAMDMARLGNKYLADMEPWKVVKTDPERVKTIMNICLQITANLTIVFAPFLPFSMNRLRGFVNLKELDWNQLGRTDIIQPGHQINKPELLFEKIDDAAIEAQMKKLMDTKKTNEIENSTAAPQKDACSYDDFQKMDIRTGTILEAEKVAKTKKLLKLKVDTGIDQRIVVSGIAEYHKPEDIIGKQILILVNLEPRKIRGIESQGMILMAEDADGSLKFVSPAEAVKNGSEVK
jgi:methionyl-tRNA synthetase